MVLVKRKFSWQPANVDDWKRCLLNWAMVGFLGLPNEHENSLYLGSSSSSGQPGNSAVKVSALLPFFWGRGGCDVGRCSGPEIAQPHAASIIPPPQSPAQWALNSTTGPCGTTPPTVRFRFPPNPNQSLNSFFLCKFPQSSSSKLLQGF